MGVMPCSGQGQKLPNTHCGVGGCAHKSPTMKWAKALKEKKNSLKPIAASHNASWYTDTDGFLEYSGSRESLYYEEPALQKMILVFWGPHTKDELPSHPW